MSVLSLSTSDALTSWSLGGHQLLPTFVERIPATSVVRMHEPGPTNRVQERVLERDRSPERDYKLPRDVYVTAIAGSSLPRWTEGRPPASKA